MESGAEDGGASESSYVFDGDAEAGGSDAPLPSSQKRSRIGEDDTADSAVFAGGARFASMSIDQLKPRMLRVVAGADARAASRGVRRARARALTSRPAPPRPTPQT